MFTTTNLTHLYVFFSLPHAVPSNQYPYTNAVPPPECICHLFPPSTRPHIFSPTNSEDGEERDSDTAAAQAESNARPTDTAVVQPEARQARPHQFVNPRHLVPLPSHVEEYLEDSDLDDPLLRQFHALTIDLPDRPWNGGPVTRGFRGPRQPRPTQEERERNREERRRRYIENRMAQEEERQRLAAEEEERRRQGEGDNEEEGSSNCDESESDESDNDDDDNDNDGEVADLSEGINRLDVASNDYSDDETSGSNSNSSQRSGRSSASSSIELTPELEALLFSQNPTGRMDQAIQSALANYIPSDEGENNASADGDGDSEEEDHPELPQNLGDEMQPMAMNFGMLGAPVPPWQWRHLLALLLRGIRHSSTTKEMSRSLSSVCEIHLR